MKRIFVLALACMAIHAQAQMPSRYKWIGNNEIAFTEDGSYNDAFSITVKGRKWTRKDGVKAPEKYSEFPLNPAGAVNLTYSPETTTSGLPTSPPELKPASPSMARRPS